MDGLAAPPSEVLVSDVISSHIAVQDDYLIWSEYSDTPIRKVPKYGGSISTLAHAMGATMNLMIHNGQIFWIERWGTRYPEIWDTRYLNKTSLDGTVTTVLAQANNYIPMGRERYADMVIYVDSVYWVTSTMGGVFSINKVPINGGESTALMTTSIPIMSLVRDDSSLYWVEWLDGGYDKGSIKKMPPNGGIPTTVYSAGNQSIVYGVMAVSGGEIVFGDIDLTQSRWRLMKVSISGGPATVLVDAISEEPTRIIIDGSSVYWADAHSVNTIPLSGGERIVLADSLGGPLDLAVVAENLFWTENYENPGSIKKVPITGGSITTLVDELDLPLRLATDGPYLYFVENFPGSACPYMDGRIARVSQDGGVIETVLSGVRNLNPEWGGIRQTVVFATDNTNVYFADGCAIKKVPLAGGLVERIWSFPLYPINSIATDGEFIYCFDNMTTISKIPVNGGEPIALTPWSPGISDQPIRLVDDIIYWASDHNTLKKMDKNGDVVVTIASNLPFLSDFVVDGENIFFSENDTGMIRRISVNGGPITTLALSLRFSWNIMALDQQNVYFINQLSIGKVPKTGGNVTSYGGLSTFLDYPSGITVDQNDLYWTETRAGTIEKMNIEPQVPPSPPTNVSASDGTYLDRVELTWAASPWATSYTVYRAASLAALAKKTVLGTTSGTFLNDTTAIPGRTYYYWVRASNTYGTSSFSAYNAGKRSDGKPPAPTNVSASDGTYLDRVEVTWTASPEATLYTVYRAPSLAALAKKTVLGTTSDTLFNDTTAVAGRTYYYWVRASNAYGTSSFSAYNAGKRSDGKPPAPTNISASDGTYVDRVEVTWAASSGATSYTVYRALSLAALAKKTALGTTSDTLFNDTTAVAGRTYYYWVRASNAYGTSSFSAYNAGKR